MGEPLRVTSNVGVEDVGLVEGEGLDDLDAAVGVVEGKGSGSGELACCRRDVERLVEAGGEGGVVGVERERIAELVRCLRVDEVERFAVGVLAGAGGSA